MNLTNTVLTAIDLQPGFERTITEARRIAEALGAQIVLLHAVPVPAMPEFGGDTTGDRDRAEARCRELSDELSQDGVRVAPDPIVAIERPSTLVLETARAHPTGLVVLGSGVKTKLHRLLLGSTVEPVLRECPRPVWVVPPTERPPMSRLLVAVDTSRAAGEALRAGAFLARKFGVRLDLMRVFPESASRAASYSRQQDELRRYAAGFDLEGIHVEYVTWEGEPGERIVEATKARASDLLVVGTAGRQGIYRWAKLPMAERAAWKISCSLLSVPFQP